MRKLLKGSALPCTTSIDVAGPELPEPRQHPSMAVAELAGMAGMDRAVLKRRMRHLITPFAQLGNFQIDRPGARLPTAFATAVAIVRSVSTPLVARRVA